MTIALSQFEQTHIEKYIKRQAGAKQAIWSILKQEGIVQPVKEWANDASAWVWDFANPGFITFGDYENAKEIDKAPTEKTAALFGVAAKMVLSPMELAQSRENALGVEKGLQELISVHTIDAGRQVNGLIANGDTSRYQATGDKNAHARGSAVKTGLFNGTNGTHLTTFATGTGADNDLGDYGDFIDTFNAAFELLAPQGVDVKRVHVVMDTKTYGKLTKSRHATSGLPEMKAIKEAYPTWTLDVDDTILEKESDDVYTDMYKIGFVAPFDVNGEPLLKLYESKELHVQPVGGGTIQSNGKYEWFIAWKGGRIAKSAYAVLVPTANLTWVGGA